MRIELWVLGSRAGLFMYCAFIVTGIVGVLVKAQ